MSPDATTNMTTNASTNALTNATRKEHHQSLPDMLRVLAALSKDRKIRPLDYQFGRFISQYESDPLVVLAATLISYHSGQGDVCLWLKNIEKSPLFGLSDYEQALYFGDFQFDNRLAGQLATALNQSDAQGPNAPLVLDDGRLYLQRYWCYEQQIARFLRSRGNDVCEGGIDGAIAHLFAPDYKFLLSKLISLRSENEHSNQACNVKVSKALQQFCYDFFNLREDIVFDTTSVEQLLAQAESEDDVAQAAALIKPQQCVNWQQLAVCIASRNSFSVISGGPGTGKTTTVTKLLALLVELNLQSSNAEPLKTMPVAPLKIELVAPLKIELVAPTGKAAARLTESITGALTTLNVPADIKALIPNKASTIHRLLGVIPRRSDFKHNKDNPLHLDVLIVDEASMIDISLMAKLLDAVPAHAKLILLGDKDQLASVESGAVFADICEGLAQGPSYSAQLNQWLTQVNGFTMSQLAPSHSGNINSNTSVINDSLCLLQKSYRFGQHSGIGQLAQAVNNSDLRSLKQVWQGDYRDICLHSIGDHTISQLSQMVINGYQPYLEAATGVESLVDVARVLNLFNQFQLLTPLRKGKVGIESLNEQIESRLNQYKFIKLNQGAWYVGRPVMVAENDHQQQLFNGDIGIVLPDINNPDSGQLRVYFKMADGEIKSFLPSRLPRVDTVYAMTIHKSQGSEFSHVVMVLPQQWTRLLTKELIYTGITRAKQSFDLFSPIDVLQKATLCSTERSSGLAKILKKSEP